MLNGLHIGPRGEAPAAERVDLKEIVQLSAHDHELFGRTFFPQTIRQPSPQFADRYWELLTDPRHRMVNAQMFRGSAKTTRFRIFTARNIAYGISRTIVYVGKSQDKAIESTQWIKNAVERNSLYAETYGLRKGAKWQDHKLQIKHEKLGHSIWLLAFGITGPVRGVNLEDYRPDLILVDDVVDEESSLTKEQRKKISDLVLGALKNSLAPRTEAPNSKLVINQTPMDFGDVSVEALKDPGFTSLVQGCWSDETKDSPLEYQESAWPERFPSEELRRDKIGYIARNKLSVWMREMECRLISPETSEFRAEWINYYDEKEEPERPVTCIAIDPVPPPSDREIAKGLSGKDYECILVLGFAKGQYWVLDYVTNRGHDPNWTIAKFFELRRRWRPRKLIVESVAYQRTLKWLFEQAMRRTGEYTQIEDNPDRRAKRDRIVDAISGPASHGQLRVRRGHSELVSQFCNYPNVPNDDVLDALAMALMGLNTVDLYEGEDYVVMDESDIPELASYRGAP